MTLEEKRQKIKEFCWSQGDEICRDKRCPLSHIEGTCYGENADIDANYRILFDENKNDVVNHPSHYTDGKIEVIDFIEDKKLGFCLGNAVKYISRAGKKDPTKEVEDLNKARWYIERRIKEITEGIG